MKKLIVLSALAAFAGCATMTKVNVSDHLRAEDGSDPIETVAIDNTTWWLFACIPLAGGDIESPNRCSCSMFNHTATMENQMKMLQTEAERAGARKAVNVTTIATSETAGGFIIVREKLHTSAVLVQ